MNLSVPLTYSRKDLEEGMVAWFPSDMRYPTLAVKELSSGAVEFLYHMPGGVLTDKEALRQVKQIYPGKVVNYSLDFTALQRGAQQAMKQATSVAAAMPGLMRG